MVLLPKFERNIELISFLSTVVAIGHINMMGKALQQRADDRRTSTKQRCYKRREKGCSPLTEDSRFRGGSFTKEGPSTRDPSSGADSPSMRSERRSPSSHTPSSHTAELPSLCSQG